jgi:hypothetical protein
MNENIATSDLTEKDAISGIVEETDVVQGGISAKPHH